MDNAKIGKLIYQLRQEKEMTQLQLAEQLNISDTLMLRKLYPEWELQVRIPIFSHGRLLWYCNRHGLFYQDV